MRAAGRLGTLRCALFAGVGLAGSWAFGCAGCASPADEAPPASRIAQDQLAASQEAPAGLEADGAAAAQPLTASLFATGTDGLLHVREVELPDLPTTRARAEALVQRVVEEAGTFPEDVQVLDVFVSGRGVAVVNFTLDLLEGHSGGLHAEELTVYSLSHALVESIPAIAEVRLLVEGQQTETLAGHLDLRSGFGRAPDRLVAGTEGRP